jgi:hypothetical protein
VLGQQPGQSGDHAIQQQRFRRLVHGADERQDTIAAIDSFLSEHFAIVAEIEEELLFRTPAEPFPDTQALGKTAHVYAHRVAPLHSFAVEHHRFFQDAEVLELIKERGDIRLAPGSQATPRRRR